MNHKESIGVPRAAEDIRWSRHLASARVVWPLLYVLFFGAVGLRLGGDGTFDYRSYHRYNGYASATGGRPQDLAAAGLQSYFYPGLDAQYFRLSTALRGYPAALHVLMALPYALAAMLVFAIGRCILPRDWPGRDWLAGAGALFGITGAASLATIGTTMSEVVPGLPLLAGLALWLTRVASRPKVCRAPATLLLLAGALCGVSVGLKLTTVAVFISLCLAVAITEFPSIRSALRSGVLFGVAGFFLAMMVAGQWWLQVYQLTGNPIFPFYNDVFRSDWVDPRRWADTRFMPTDISSILVYPWVWAFRDSHAAIELDMHDPRLLLELVALVFILIAAVTGRASHTDSSARRMSAIVAFFLLVAYIFWEYQFSVYRYLALIECLSGVMILAAVAAWVPRRRAVPACLVVVVLGIAVGATTKYPWWGRMPGANEVKLPNIAPDALVILLDRSVLSYVAPELPPAVRIVAAYSNLVWPGVIGTLMPRIEAVVRTHPGPIWGLENPGDFPGIADVTLAHLKLLRSEECTPIESNIENERARPIACRLLRHTTTSTGS